MSFTVSSIQIEVTRKKKYMLIFQLKYEYYFGFNDFITYEY